MKINKKFNQIWKEYVERIHGKVTLDVENWKPQGLSEAHNCKTFFEFLDKKGYVYTYAQKSTTPKKAGHNYHKTKGSQSITKR